MVEIILYHGEVGTRLEDLTKVDFKAFIQRIPLGFCLLDLLVSHIEALETRILLGSGRLDLLIPNIKALEISVLQEPRHNGWP